MYIHCIYMYMYMCIHNHCIYMYMYIYCIYMYMYMYIHCIYMYMDLYFLQGDPTTSPYPKYVWTPTGGWHCNPPNWKKNTVLAMLFALASSGVMWYVSAQLEVSLPFQDLKLLYICLEWMCVGPSLSLCGTIVLMYKSV